MGSPTNRLNFNSEIDLIATEENPLYSMYDLSFIEILIVNQIVKHATHPSSNKTSILRHDLYKQINDLVKNHKPLSTSSFYRSLKKLAERGFLEEKKSSDVHYRNAVEVYPTQYASRILGYMMHFMVLYNQDISVLEYIESNLTKELTPHLNPEDLRIVHIIDPSISIYSATDLISSILPDAVRIRQILERLMMPSPGIAFSIDTMSTEQIFDWNDPGNRSDLVVFPLYEKNISYQGLSYLEILEKTKPMVKPGKFYLLIHLDPLTSDHHYIDILGGLLDKSTYFATYDSEVLDASLQDIGLHVINRFSYRGVSFVLVKRE
ncbi:MAG: hypothetical protein ACXAE3_07855 [Candidatus Kariarchaeaceae archaeon]|jgi:hypothetical protein